MNVHPRIHLKTSVYSCFFYCDVIRTHLSSEPTARGSAFMIKLPHLDVSYDRAELFLSPPPPPLSVNRWSKCCWERLVLSNVDGVLFSGGPGASSSPVCRGRKRSGAQRPPQTLPDSVFLSFLLGPH